MQKSWYLSKTLWVNAIAMVALIIQTATGKEIMSPDIQAIILTLANILLRIITKHELV